MNVGELGILLIILGVVLGSISPKDDLFRPILIDVIILLISYGLIVIGIILLVFYYLNGGL